MWKIWNKTWSPKRLKPIKTDWYIDYASVFFDGDEKKFIYHTSSHRLALWRDYNSIYNNYENKREDIIYKKADEIVILFSRVAHSHIYTKEDKDKFYWIKKNWAKINIDRAQEVINILNSHYDMFHRKSPKK